VKRLVLCSDGTWNSPDQTDRGERCPSNVVLTARSVAPQDRAGVAQVVFYDRGVGTAWGMDKLVGGAFGTGLSRNVEDGYRFLVDNHAAGDHVFMFGFSRGAYTVRSIAGLIRKCGLLEKRHVGRFPDAYALYRDRATGPDDPKAMRFRNDFSRAMRLRFLGVWDTVGALGVPGMMGFLSRYHQFHDVTLSRSVERAYHAVAIDERRKWFKPALWKTQDVPGQIVEQVWFAGVHTNVGGGYADTGLSDVAFQWMKQKAQEAGLEFDEEAIRAVGRPDPLGEMRNSKKGMYRLLPDLVRPIGMQENGCESVHPSVFDRMRRKLPRYRPENLIEWMKRTGTTMEGPRAQPAPGAPAREVERAATEVAAGGAGSGRGDME
jgi:uncharacterized protein (DUF2235 family)